MSKNSAIQTYEVVKAYAQMLENKRKRNSKTPNVKPKMKKYHPSQEYNG